MCSIYIGLLFHFSIKNWKLNLLFFLVYFCILVNSNWWKISKITKFSIIHNALTDWRSRFRSICMFLKYISCFPNYSTKPPNFSSSFPLLFLDILVFNFYILRFQERNICHEQFITNVHEWTVWTYIILKFEEFVCWDS